MEKYTLTEEHRARFPEYVKRWTDNAMSTKAMDHNDRAACQKAVARMYSLAGLKPPRVVFVSSPFIGRFAAGFAAAIWYNRRECEKHAATRAATRAATDAATHGATRAATDAATRAATDDATYAATRDATYDATDAATNAATYAATEAAS